MKKALFLFFWLFSFSAQAQEAVSSDSEEQSYSASITPTQRWLTESKWRDDVDYAAENYRPERLKEMARAAESVQKRKALRAKGRNEPNDRYRKKHLNPNDADSVKDYLNDRFKKDMDQAVNSNEVLYKDKINVQ